MFKKILIANRSEIAVRVIRAAREMGIKTCAIFSTEDKDSIHVRLADESICIGPPPASESYLKLLAVMQAILHSGADAVHPGYGFLSENPSFAKACRDVGVTFIGPDAETMERLADKSEVKKILKEAGVPTIPGSDGSVDSEEELVALSRDIGFPLLLKASWGGGGRGMRIVRDPSRLVEEFRAARLEAKQAFGRDEVYVERFIEHPRHIEVQIMADEFGNVVHIGERDCSLQRRHQKLLEESPSPSLDGETRRKLHETAVKAASVLGYKNAGTLEFLYDGREFYFIEINTRIQVEHPVSEMAFGVDIVKEQINVAAGNKLSMNQDDIQQKFCTMECRVNAEHPFTFKPSPGVVGKLYIPGGPGVRVDTAMYSGGKVSPYYDSLIAKLIVSGRTRNEARIRMLRALEEFIVEGVETSIEFFKEILSSEDFINNNYDTNYIDLKYLKGHT